MNHPQRQTTTTTRNPKLLLFLWCGLLTAALGPSTAFANNVHGGQVKVVDCWELMRDADDNNDNRLDVDEYWDFTKLYDHPSNGGEFVYKFLDDASEAPNYWWRTWNALLTVCTAEPSEQSAACEAQNNGTIYRQAVPPLPEITGNSDLYVFTVCYATQAALLKSLNSAAPSLAPTDSPSESPSTASPTDEPTQEPTSTPTESPSKTPSRTPTRSPTRSPNFDPTASPSAAPSKSPSRPPSPLPTSSPTSPDPTSSPSESPTPEPSKSPTQTPTAAPTTQAPSSSPTTQAPTAPVEISQSAQFDLAYRHDTIPVSQVSQNANVWTDLFSDTVIAVNALVTEAVEALDSGGRRLRRLDMDIARQCELTNPVTFTCPTDGSVATDAACLTVTMTCYVLLTGEDTLNANSISTSFLTKWLDLALQGKFQSYLDIATNPYPRDIQYVDSRSVNALRGGETDVTQNFSSALTGGIVTGAIVAVILPFVILLLYRNRTRDRDEKQKVYYEPYDPAEDAPSELEPDAMDAELYHTASPPKSQARGLNMLGASRPSYGMTKATQKYLEDVERGEDILAEPEFDVERDSSSNAGSSGWSSSAGYSSYNTGSIDDDMDAALAAGTTLAAIGVTSSLSKMRGSAEHPSSPSVTSSSPSISRDQLDSFIEAGDWAAVGATAALLAAASDSQSASTNDRSRRSRTSSYESDSLEAARAAELDHLVDAGDWEGVVLAAARFEAAEMTVSSRSRDSRTASSVASTGSNSHTDDGGATGSSPSQSESATGSDDPSRARQRREVRAEVEALVRRVVPEEIDNVDEMMNQFKGREEELVETLRTMQERAIAQKARSAGHKSAKLEARKNVKRGVVPGARPPPPVAAQPPPTSTSPTSSSQPSAVPLAATAAAVTGVAAAAAVASRPDSKSSSSGTVSDGQESSTLGSLQDARTALDKAIDAGDWEAVGQTAAFMSDASITTSETGEIERMGHSNISTTTSGSTRTRQTKDSETAIRAAELDEMISRGDWSAVVAAANRFSQMDKKVKSELGRTAEEEEALAQAEFWTNIANQKKAQGANDVGASDAAEWAIQRSLSQMNKKDSSTPNKNEGNDEDEV